MYSSKYHTVKTREYYTTYPKTPEKRAGKPNFRLGMRAPFHPFVVT
jgi:hypothetical protein